jgi:hypothetical protein
VAVETCNAYLISFGRQPTVDARIPPYALLSTWEDDFGLQRASWQDQIALDKANREADQRDREMVRDLQRATDPLCSSPLRPSSITPPPPNPTPIDVYSGRLTPPLNAPALSDSD